MSKVMQKIPFLRLSYKKPLASVAFTYVRTVLLSLVWRSIVFAWCCSLGLWVLTEMEAVVLVPSCYNGVRIFSCVGPCLLQALWQLPRKARGTESTYCRVRDWYDSHFGCLYQFVRRLKFSLRESKIKNLFSFSTIVMFRFLWEASLERRSSGNGYFTLSVTDTKKVVDDI